MSTRSSKWGKGRAAARLSTLVKEARQMITERGMLAQVTRARCACKERQREKEKEAVSEKRRRKRAKASGRSPGGTDGQHELKLPEKREEETSEGLAAVRCACKVVNKG